MWQLCWIASWLVGLIRSRLTRPAAAVTRAEKAGAAAQAAADVRVKARAEAAFARAAVRATVQGRDTVDAVAARMEWNDVAP